MIWRWVQKSGGKPEFEIGISKAISLPLTILMLTMTIFSGILLPPAAEAAELPLDAGNVIFTINDYGVITGKISWSIIDYGIIPQTHPDNDSFLTIYHDAYPTGGGDADVASGYGAGTGDFTVDEQSVYLQTGSVQEAYSSFTQTGVPGVANDLKIYQRAFSMKGENWAIVMWKLENIYGQDIQNLRVGMNFHTRIADTGGDDLDHWNSIDSIYYIEDEPTGTMLMGLASADPTVPINRYYGKPAGGNGAVNPADDKSLYQSLIKNNVHSSADDMTCMVGWEVGTLPAGSNVTLPLMIAFGSAYDWFPRAVGRAREFLTAQMKKTLITEVQDFASADNAKIEIYNDGLATTFMSELYLSPDVWNHWTAGTWSKDSISPGEYSVYSLGPGEAFLSLEGGTIGVYYYTGLTLDIVSFGQMGPAPDPLDDESIARYRTGNGYSDEWERDPTPTFGAANDVAGRRSSPPIVLNEVYFDADSPNDRFLEVYHQGSLPVDTTGWTLVVDSQYSLPSMVLDTTKRYFVLRGEDFPLDFDMDDGTANGDNVYLYDELGRLVDMVGWSLKHTKGYSMARLDDPAEWGFDAFNDYSSWVAGWRFDRTLTPETIRLEPKQHERVYVGEIVEYNVLLGYFGSCDDVLDITYNSTLGWETNITDENGNPIMDHDGDTIPDSDHVVGGSTFDLKVQVTVPLFAEMWSENTVYVTATSSVNSLMLDTVLLGTTSIVPPYVTVNESAQPDTIWLEGSHVSPQETTVTLSLMGAGATREWYLGQDTVFVIDNSGSMSWNDPGNLRLAAAKTYVDMMRRPDRAATVRFTDSAILVNGHHLTSDYVQVKTDLSFWPASGGTTDITTGIVIATDELVDNGHPNHVHVEILLTDGFNSAGVDSETIEAAKEASEEDIMIFTIGLGPDVDEKLLKQIANITGGKYYFAPTPEALEDIYLAIYRSLEPIGVAGKRIEDQMEPNPMVRDILPPFIHYVPGSFRDQSSDPYPPDVVTINSDGSTMLDWDVEEILIEESWVVEFEVTSSLGGHVPVGVFPSSRVNYSKWDSSTETVPFPEVFINVLVPEPVRTPILSIETDQKDVHLSWTVPGPNISHYLIYGAPNQIDINLFTPIYDTSADVDPQRTNWTDVGAASPSASREYYYVVRAVNNLGTKSMTSNTVGKWTRHFDSGLNTFSQPLEPIIGHDIEWYASSIPNAVYIDWMDSSDHWVRHFRGDPPGRVDSLTIGEGFQLFLSASTDFTFVGSPASMIRYHEGLGDSITFRKGLRAFVIQNDVRLHWKPVTGAIGYNIYRADNRMTFHTSSLNPLVSLNASTTSWADSGALTQPSNWYYMVVPITEAGKEGSSTFSIGVLSISYAPGHTTVGLPLKPIGIWTLDHYCESMQTVTGMAYMIEGEWKFHATQMPVGVYDPFVEQGEGYQISIDGKSSRYTFVGY